MKKQKKNSLLITKIKHKNRKTKKKERNMNFKIIFCNIFNGGHEKQ